MADIVRRARVSRAAFYAHFANKEECFSGALPDLEDTLVSLHLAVLAGRPWAQGES